MNKISLALSTLLMLAMVIIIAPGVVAMNRGKVLRNVAIWLAMLTALALVYQNLGPGSQHPLFNLPAAMVRDESSQAGIHKPEDDKNDGQGFTPPKD